jgi:hypothetical protein
MQTMLNRTYGVWTFPSKDPLAGKRVYREDRHGDQLQSRFYRAIGSTYEDRSMPRLLDARGGIVGCSARSNHHTPLALLKGFFSRGHPKRHRVRFQAGSVDAVVGCKGYALISTKRQRRLSVPGIAVFIGVVRVRATHEP